MRREAAVYIRADYGDVWNHLTEAEEYAAWSSAPGLEFGEAPGDPVAWGAPERTIYAGKLVEIEKGKGFVHTFAFQGFGFDEQSTVTVDVLERGEVVLVHLRHDCTDAPSTHEVIGPLGWTKSLCRLKTLLETGEPMPWPDDDG